MFNIPISFLDLTNPSSELVIDILDIFSTISPRENTSALIPPDVYPYLTEYNRRILNKEITDADFDRIIKYYLTSKNNLSNISTLRTNFGKYSNINSYANRFNNRTNKYITNIGIDGSGKFPLNYSQEKRALAAIINGAEEKNKWESFSDEKDENIFRESVENIMLWPKTNMAQLPIGTPVQMASAIIQFFSPRDNENEDNTELKDKLTGQTLLNKRIECKGLEYLLEGNKEDIDNSSINGIRIFEDQTFRRFFFKSGGGKDITIHYPNSSGSFTDKQLCLNDNKLFNETEWLENVINDTSPTQDDKYCAVLLVFTVCFLYFAYIYDLYRKKLIKKLKDIVDEEKINEYNTALNDTAKNFYKYLNLCVSKYFFDKEIEDLVFVSTNNNNEDIAKDLKLNQVLNSIHPDELKEGIHIRFKNKDHYKENIQNVNKENYPFQFREYVSGDTLHYVNYRNTIEKLTSFLLTDRSTPIGAPMQNEDILRASGEAAQGYYEYLTLSKTKFLQYMDIKLGIYRSCVPAREITELRDYLFNNFNLINNTVTSPIQKDLECTKLVGKIMERYKKLRKEEIKLTDEKTIFVSGQKRLLGEDPKDYPKQMARAMKRVRAGGSAIAYYNTAVISFNSYQKKHGIPCNNFIPLLNQKKNELDTSFTTELTKIITRRKAEINRKYGPNALKSAMQMASLVNFSTIPGVPQPYLNALGGILSTAGVSIPGLSSGPSMMGVPGAPASGPGGPIGKKPLQLEQRLRVEQRKFWEDLRTAFSGKSIFLPVTKLSRGIVFDDTETYFLDIITSMIFNQIVKVELTKSGKITPKAIFEKIQQKGYILFNAYSAELGFPSKWKAVNHKNLSKMLTRRDGTIRFSKIRNSRCVFFNLLANNGFLNDSINVAIPEASNTSLSIVRYCTNALKKDLPKCNIIISRQQFGQTVQDKMQMLTGTKNIDMVSGMSYAEFSEYAGISNNNIIRR